MLLIWMALGTAWKWRKFRGGFACSGIGYWVDFDRCQLASRGQGPMGSMVGSSRRWRRAQRRWQTSGLCWDAWILRLVRWTT